MTPPFPVEATGDLEEIGGKIANIESSTRNGNRFILTPLQTASNLTVYNVKHIQDNSAHLAFCFKLNGKMYYPVVERDSTTNRISIKVMELKRKKFDNFPVRYLFKWNTNGEYGSLCSVAESNQYLSVEGNSITLSTTPVFKFRINLNAYKTRKTLSDWRPQIPFVFSFSSTPGLPLIVYSDYCTFDEDSEMKKDK